MNRRELIKRGTGLALAAGVLGRADVVDASKAWCRVDPIVWYADGTKIMVSAVIAAEHERLVTGDVGFEVLYPEDNPPVKVVTLPGLNGFGESVNTQPYGLLGFEVCVPATARVPVRVEVASKDGTARHDGFTNEWIATY